MEPRAGGKGKYRKVLDKEVLSRHHCVVCFANCCGNEKKTNKKNICQVIIRDKILIIHFLNGLDVFRTLR